jgi:uncharacterized protein YkwD
MRFNACVRRRAGARQPSLARKRRAATALAFAAVALPAAGASAPAAAQVCAGASLAPGAASNAALRRALRCLVNGERARHGLRRVRRNRRLASAAGSHAGDMVARGYFAHERAGWTLRGRLRAAGWTGAGVGEAIAWGCGGLGMPRAVLDGWLASPPHRAIVLGPYDRAGFGLALGSPLADCRGAATWVLDAGSA